MLDRIYADFVTKVAAGRVDGPTTPCTTIARGRVWTGADAARRTASSTCSAACATPRRIAREQGRAGPPTRRCAPPCTSRRWPGSARPRSSEDPRALAASVTLSPWGDLAGLAAALGLPGGGPLRMPGIRLV